jgi:uncharacterized protein YjgD (DUF1641 family)
MQKENFIKLSLPGEKFWAKLISQNTAQIENVLLNNEYSLGDIVMFNENNEVTLLLKKVSNTALVKYEFDLFNIEEMVTNVEKIIHYFGVKGIKSEPAILGVILIAVPVGITSEQVLNIANNCPVKVEINFLEKE